jgi:hypothetical protein
MVAATEALKGLPLSVCFAISRTFRVREEHVALKGIFDAPALCLPKKRETNLHFLTFAYIHAFLCKNMAL